MKHHRGTKERKCDIVGCEKVAERSLPTGRIEEAIEEKLLEWEIDKLRRRTHLCKTHYKEYKKATKAERDLERLGWGH